MNHTIQQFMWDFQPHFRFGVKRGIERALSRIGVPLNARVVLVGFSLDDSPQHPIHIESEAAMLSVDHFEAIPDRTQELFEANPESNIIHSNRRLHELRLKGLFRRSRADAIAEAIEASGVFEGLTFFASSSAPQDSYEVHTCVGVATITLDSLPTLDSSVVGRVYVGRSLQHEVIVECLRRADNALYLPEPGAAMAPLGSTEDIIETAAVRLTDGATYRATNWPQDLFSRVIRSPP